MDLLAPGAAERVHDGTAINIGTMERMRVIDAAREILRRTGVDARIETDPSQPTGPYDRVADNALARRRLDWTPRVSSGDGLDRTIAWYWAAHDRDHVRRELARRLTER